MNSPNSRGLSLLMLNWIFWTPGHMHLLSLYNRHVAELHRNLRREEKEQHMDQRSPTTFKHWFTFERVIIISKDVYDEGNLNEVFIFVSFLKLILSTKNGMEVQRKKMIKDQRIKNQMDQWSPTAIKHWFIFEQVIIISKDVFEDWSPNEVFICVSIFKINFINKTKLYASTKQKKGTQKSHARFLSYHWHKGNWSKTRWRNSIRGTLWSHDHPVSHVIKEVPPQSQHVRGKWQVLMCIFCFKGLWTLKTFDVT